MVDGLKRRGVALQGFTDIDDTHALETYIAALENFDAIPQLQQLKSMARQAVTKATSVLDVGCGFGLETERLARELVPGAKVAGIDKSQEFLDEARRRAEIAGLNITYDVGDAAALPYADRSFDVVRAERLLIYLDDPAAALAEMRRVSRPEALLALIEPDLTLMSVNLPDRDLVRHVLAHECDHAVRHSWLPGQLHDLLAEAGFTDVSMETRVLLFPQDLALAYFSQAAATAHDDDHISADERVLWQSELSDLHDRHRLFCTIGYFLFMARA